MELSIFDLFSIGIGPSSSHTVGPMKAAKRFALALEKNDLLSAATRVEIILYGSLGFTGKAHGSEKAILMGLEGEDPENLDPDEIPERIKTITEKNLINLLKKKEINFSLTNDLIFNRTETLPLHSNGMKFFAYTDNNLILEKTYYSVGGGFVHSVDGSITTVTKTSFPYSFTSGRELLEKCKSNNLSISSLVLENEKSLRPESEIKEKVLSLWYAMDNCIKKGYQTSGILPGGLKVKRRAHDLYSKLNQDNTTKKNLDPLKILDWVSLYAISVNEENAAGGKVVTAPTNGAAGIIPAVLSYYVNFCNGNQDGIIKFLLTASAIASLFKLNASISGAEVGCQGEVGVACSMAAAGLTEVMGGTPEQVENAAEIGMEHNLGLTCDPIGGLVQVPCIERNAMGAVKAINASRLALQGDGSHFVHLDKVIKTMKETGKDMMEKYKETSRGGLAVNVIEC